MRALQERAERLARAAQQRRAGQLAEEWRNGVPGAAISVDTAGVTIVGRGLRRRWLVEPLLRFSGWLR